MTKFKKFGSKAIAMGMALAIANPLTAFASEPILEDEPVIIEEIPAEESEVPVEPETPETPVEPEEPTEPETPEIPDETEEPVDEVPDEEVPDKELPDEEAPDEEEPEELTKEQLEIMKASLIDEIEAIKERIAEIPLEIEAIENEIAELDEEAEDYEEVKASKEASIQVLKLEKLFKEKDLEEKQLELQKIERLIEGLTIEELLAEIKELKLEKLDVLIERAEKVAENNFNKDPETIEALKEVIKKAEEVKNKEEVEMEELDEIIKELLEAIEGVKETEEEKLVERIAGENRFATAVEVSKKAYPNGSETVIIANGESMVDALTASLLGKKLDAPILLVTTNSIDKATSKEIERLRAERVVIVGGVNSVSNALEMGFKHKDITRIAGLNRYETAREVAKAININADRFVVVSGKNMIDALTASSLATSQDMPILLVDDGDVKVPQSAKKVIIIGGESSVSKANADLIKVEKERIAGKDRFETAKVLAERFSPESTKFIIANGAEAMVDALTASSLVHKLNAPILLTSGESLVELPEKANQAFIVGGERSVSEAVKADLEKQLIVEVPEEPVEPETPETPAEPEEPTEPETPETPDETEEPVDEEPIDDTPVEDTETDEVPEA